MLKLQIMDELLLLEEDRMSRSYKHVPCCKDHNRGMKKMCNRYVRRNYLVVPSGMAYKKLFCSWNICDYKFFKILFFFQEKRILNIIVGKYSDKELYRMWYNIIK